MIPTKNSRLEQEKPSPLLNQQQLHDAGEVITERFGPLPDTALILGSGLGTFTTALQHRVELNTVEIPAYPHSTTPGHQGKWVVGDFANRKVLVVQGRIHGYEGYDSQQIVFPIHLLARGGVKKLIITNAAGAANRIFAPGDLMLIEDHINFTFKNPLFGLNETSDGPRFPDMVSPYDPDLLRQAVEVGLKHGIALRRGVYLGLMGPSYETPAEVRMAATLGADAIGMSTVQEVIAAVYHGMRVLGISCITNMGTGLSREKISHEDVTKVGQSIQKKFIALLQGIQIVESQLQQNTGTEHEEARQQTLSRLREKN